MLSDFTNCFMKLSLISQGENMTHSYSTNGLLIILVSLEYYILVHGEDIDEAQVFGDFLLFQNEVFNHFHLEINQFLISLGSNLFPHKVYSFALFFRYDHLSYKGTKPCWLLFYNNTYILQSILLSSMKKCQLFNLFHIRRHSKKFVEILIFPMYNVMRTSLFTQLIEKLLAQNNLTSV